MSSPLPLLSRRQWQPTNRQSGTQCKQNPRRTRHASMLQEVRQVHNGSWHAQLTTCGAIGWARQRCRAARPNCGIVPATGGARNAGGATRILARGAARGGGEGVCVAGQAGAVVGLECHGRHREGCAALQPRQRAGLGRGAGQGAACAGKAAQRAHCEIETRPACKQGRRVGVGAGTVSFTDQSRVAAAASTHTPARPPAPVPGGGCTATVPVVALLALPSL